MVVVAVVGGTGPVGRPIAEAIIAQGRYEVVIISRKANDDLAREIGAPIFPVDYQDVEGLTATFESHKVHTIISTLASLTSQGQVTPEVNVIQAAQASRTTLRFVLNNWSVPITQGVLEFLPNVIIKKKALEAVLNTDLEYTAIYAGLFMDYYTYSRVKTYLPRFTAVVDSEHDMAVIPGSGDVPVTSIHTFDLAKYVAGILDFQKWDPEYYVIGDKFTWNEFVELSEQVKGTKFRVVHDSVADLQQGRATELPAMTKYFAEKSIPAEYIMKTVAGIGLAFERGAFDLKEEGALNEKFPEIRPLKIKDAVKAFMEPH